MHGDKDGFDRRRWPSNQLEEKFAVEWQKYNHNQNILKYLLSDEVNKDCYVEEHDEQIVNCLIQWLGSQCGQHFLRTVLGEDAL